MLSRAAIARLVPHHGAMCLLDSVQSWDHVQIICTATSHRDHTHPLRDGNTLRALCGIEYAAQAIAVHSSLLAGTDRDPHAVGLLVAVRNVIMEVERLDDIPQELKIRADKLIGQGHAMVYDFAISAGTRPLLSGRVSVMAQTGGSQVRQVTENQPHHRAL